MNAMPSIWQVLARTSEIEKKLQDAAPVILLLFGILVAAIIVGCMVVFFIRRRSLRDNTTQTKIPLSLSEIRRMHDAGEIDDDEMQRLKDIVTEQTTGHAPPTPVPPPVAEASPEVEEKET